MRLNELPYEQFKLLGVTKSDIINLPPRTLNALLNGQRTSLIRFKNVEIAGLDAPVSLDAKLSIELKANNQPVLKMHPVNKTAKNAFSLTAEEIAILENDKVGFIERKVRLADGATKEVMIFLDRITNEFVAVNKTSINAPEEINGIRLSEKDKENFRDGKPVALKDDIFLLNPNSEIGISSKDGNDMKINTVRFKNSSYSKKELALDLVLFASGFENFILLEHLANIVYYTAPDRLLKHDTISNIGSATYWQAMNEVCEEINRLGEDDKCNMMVISAIVNKHLEELGIIEPSSGTADHFTKTEGTDAKRDIDGTPKARRVRKVKP